MTRLLLLAPLLFFLSSCDDENFSPPDGRGNGAEYGGSRDRGGEYSGRRPSIKFVEERLGGGGSNLYVRINGTDYVVERNIENFSRISPGSYGAMGIPRNAAVAGQFWGWDAHEEDSQGVYAEFHGGHVDVFTGYYAPGAMHDVRWKRVRSIADY